MQDIDLSQIKSIHFIGIGGIGISAIARMMIAEGKAVSGQDMQESEILGDLRKLGAKIKIGQSIENIPKGTDLVVYTIAIANFDHGLFQDLQNQAESGGVPIRSYPEMLSIVTRGKYTIAVSGTHGKTTTVGMTAHILKNAGLDPTVIIGSLMSDSNSNFVAGESKYFVVEACEYRRSFLNINPNILVITNIDADHLDYYKDIEDIKKAFRELALKVPSDGFVVCNPTDEHMIDVVAGIDAKVVDYERFVDEELDLQMPGLHNKKNASAAYAVADLLGVGKEQIKGALASFEGTARRFEYKGDTKAGAKVYDDYAHHPREILASLQGFRELYPRSDGWKVIVVFQPHLFSRTKAFIDDFAQSFADADQVLLLPIYYAREEDDGSVSSAILAEKISDSGVQAQAFADFPSTQKYLSESRLDDHTIVITMGAGEAFVIGNSIL